MTTREQMIETAQAVIAADHPVPLTFHGVALAVLDAVLPQVSTVEELEALSPLTVVVTQHGSPAVLGRDSRSGGRYLWKDGVRFALDSVDHWGPFTVVWRPE